jgi:hypothetical protein
MRDGLSEYSQLPVDLAIDKACLESHPHHNCLAWDKRMPVYLALKSSEPFIRMCGTFEDLYDVVASCVGSQFKRANLYKYDLSLRIGAAQGVYPVHVYLHRGAMDGARKILIGRPLGSRVAVSQFPRPVQALDPHEIEDFLCVFADML